MKKDGSFEREEGGDMYYVVAKGSLLIVVIMSDQHLAWNIAPHLWQLALALNAS